MLAAAVVALGPLPAGAQTVETHDNLKPAGTLRDGVLSVSLWAGTGQWKPSGSAAAPISIAAFGEEGGPLSVPSPLLRAPEGTEIRVSIRNTLKAPLIVRGLCDRPGPCSPVTIAAGSTGSVRMTLKRAGTFHYWASTGAPSIETRFAEDAQLGGALIADEPGAPATDRVFVLGLMRDTVDPSRRDLTVINGRSWPHTERLKYTTGDTARWRIVNLTLDPHAMHLHGFYFKVHSVGDGISETRYAEGDVREGVTEQMAPGRTMTMTWVPERAGEWLFHCHMLVHMMPTGHDAHAADSGDGPAAGMAGLVLGVSVTGPAAAPAAPDRPRRELQLSIADARRHATAPSYELALTSNGVSLPRLNERRAPGPVMVLTRGEPVAVEIRNGMRQPTAIHWHGIELESFDDGVPGFGATAGSVTPPVAPGGSFTARFTPSRAGTFIYHTHWHDTGQLAGGIYGPLIVLEPGETYDPSRDHIVLIGLDGDYDATPEPVVINGDAQPRPLELAAGVSHRLRFINITANNVAFTLQLVDRYDPIKWTLVSKDGAASPPSQRTARPARQLVSVGETYDFELAPMTARPVGLWLELRRGNGELLRQWPVQVK